MKKTISLFVAICLLAGLMSGCSFKRVSAEEDIINMQSAGYLYTSQTRAKTSAERSYLKAREKTVSNLIKTMEKAADNSFNVTSGIEKYEDNLIDYLAKTENVQESDINTINGIMEKMLTYKTVLQSYEEAIAQYMKMNPETNAGEIIIKTYEIAMMTEMLDIQGEYIAWLTDNTASAAYILSKTNERQAEKLVSSSASIYKKHIETEWDKTYELYEEAGAINSTIVSADYYTDWLYLQTAQDNLIILRKEKSVSEADITELENLLQEASTLIKKPPSLIPLPVVKSSFSFTKSVQAEAATEGSFKTIKELFNTKIEPEESTLVPSSEEIETQITEKQQQIESSPEMMAKVAASQPNSPVQPKKSAGLFSSFESGIKNLFGEVSDATKEFGIKLAITLAQNSIKKSSSDNNVRYIKIIQQMTSMLSNAKSDKVPDQTANIYQLIHQDLIRMLGENRDLFVDYILNTKAETLMSTFEQWKDKIGHDKDHIFTRVDVIQLLGLIGIKAEVIATAPPLPAPSDQSSQTASSSSSSGYSPSASASQPPASASDTPDYSDDPEMFGFTEIIADYDLLIKISSEETNARVLMMIFGWSDPLVYANYTKVEEKDDAGNIIKTYYIDSDENMVGWEERIAAGGISVVYEYHFPGDESSYISITRKGSFEDSYITRIRTNYPKTGSTASIELRAPDHPESQKYGVIVSQKHNGVYHGIITSNTLSSEGYSIYSEGKLLDSYIFENQVLTKTIHMEYEGEDEIRTDTWYFENGKPRRVDSFKNGKDDGVFLSYYENNNLRYRIWYKDDQRHGTHESFYENGRPKSLSTYDMGVKHGLFIEYFDNEAEQIEVKYSMANGALHGIRTKYTADGVKTFEKTYKEGILDGPSYSAMPSEDYFQEGQYTNGEETGIWTHSSSKGWHYKIEYSADGVKLWDWYKSRGYKTYYNPDGTVSHSEEMN